jgi:hypothetical protein
MRLRRRVVGTLALASFGALLTAPGVALGADGPPVPDVSAVSQYVEVIPTGSGGTAGGIAKAQSTAIPKHIHVLLVRQGGRDAAKLTAIASSSAYGAPQKRAHSNPEKRLPTQNVLSAAISAGGTASHTLWLFAILAATTIATLVAARKRHRPRR